MATPLARPEQVITRINRAAKIELQHALTSARRQPRSGHGNSATSPVIVSGQISAGAGRDEGIGGRVGAEGRAVNGQGRGGEKSGGKGFHAYSDLRWGYICRKITVL